MQLAASSRSAFSSAKRVRASAAPRVAGAAARRTLLRVRASGEEAAASSDPPARQAIAGFVSGIYKATAAFQPADPSMPPLWQALTKLDKAGVEAAIRAGADLNARNAKGDTPLLYIAREGHYKFPPKEIPLALIQAGADLEAKDASGKTALQVALLSGWQNIAELLIKSKAQTGGVPAIKGAVTCPDCKRIIAQYAL